MKINLETYIKYLVVRNLRASGASVLRSGTGIKDNQFLDATQLYYFYFESTFTHVHQHKCTAWKFTPKKEKTEKTDKDTSSQKSEG